MSIPGVASDAADKINEEQVTDEGAEIDATEEADELENANIYKEENEHEEDSGEPSQEETKELKQGAFHTHAFPHLNVQDTEAPDTKGEGTEKSGESEKLKETGSDSVANGNRKEDTKERHVRYFGRGGAGGGSAARRQSVTGEQFNSEMAELARAEAASWAQMMPLLAATFGPLSVLLGIPTLTQRWHGVVLNPPLLPGGRENFIALPDPTLNLILAGFTLFCEVMGNFLLILRFSNFHTRVTTWVSYIFWILKIIFGLANYIEFGIVHPQTDTIIYLQGFWVGVCSMGVTVIILIFLTINLAFLHRQSPDVTRRLHYVQREFMLQTTMFFVFTGLYALIFCKVEGTTYVDGIYYTTVTTLTIGFGDLVPHTVVMKVLTFPFVIIGITLLALIVTSIVRLLADRARRRKLELKKRLKKNISARKRIHGGYGSKLKPWAKGKSSQGPPLKRTLTLQEEIQKLREDDWKRERRANLKSMAIGFSVFIIFWFIGALIFDFVEIGWGYGNALYFCYVFFLTIGFGDYYPTSEAGVPIFIVYALLAVPTMTIIVETVTTNFTAFTMQRVHRKRNQVYEDKDFQIQSLNSLVKAAKEKHCDNFERVDTEAQDPPPVVLPFHHFTESLTDSLQEMHHHLQSLLMQKLGPDARNVIAAERARLNREERNKLEKTRSKREEKQRDSDYIATRLSEVGQNDKDELELLNEYRERYAEILAELLVARDRLIEMDKTLQRTAGAKLARRLSEDLSEISDDEVGERRRRMDERRRRRSSVRSDCASEDEPDDASKRRKWLARRRRSSSIQERPEGTSVPIMDDWGKWN